MTAPTLNSRGDHTHAAPPWRVVIADDEPLARTRLRGLLARHPAFMVVAECAHGGAVLDALETAQVDVVFLDVRMPQMDGVAVASAIRRGRDVATSESPAIVFVTAFDAHATRAFDLEALDYLVKPVDLDRFDRTVQRLTAHLLQRQASAETIVSSVRTLQAAFNSLGRSSNTAAFPARFSLRDAKGIYFVATSDIDRVEADGNYVALVVGGRRHLLRETMRRMEARLDPAHFVRVHRSTIVRIEAVRRMQPCGHGEYDITLVDGTRITSSRSCSDAVRRLLR